MQVSLAGYNQKNKVYYGEDELYGVPQTEIYYSRYLNGRKTREYSLSKSPEFSLIKSLMHLLLFKIEQSNEAVLRPRVHMLKSQIRDIRDNPENHPLEYASEVVFDDTKGLELLLERTAANEALEWGTVIKTKKKVNAAVVEDIMLPAEAEKRGLIHNRTKDSICILSKDSAKKGYSGTHHYHPGLHWAKNFFVNSTDLWSSELNTINLITFNMPKGPELVGHNKQFVYIPKNSADKSVLVRAEPNDIISYLAKEYPAGAVPLIEPNDIWD